MYNVHWLYTAVSSVPPVYTLSNPVSSYTGATLVLLQCMYSVHCSVYPVYTLTDTDIGSGQFLGKRMKFIFGRQWTIFSAIHRKQNLCGL